MIRGEVNVKDTLSIIRESQIVFELTGSRFFGTQTEESDWDFFAQDCPEVHQFLKSKGFYVEQEAYKGSPNFTIVYRLDNVHVQLVDDVKTKSWVQQQMLSFFKANKPSKEQAKKLWNLCLKLYLTGMEEGRRLRAKFETQIKEAGVRAYPE